MQSLVKVDPSQLLIQAWDLTGDRELVKSMRVYFEAEETKRKKLL